MGRSRKMPPLFEVMRETDRRGADARESHPPGTILPRPTDPAPAQPSAETREANLRLSHQSASGGTSAAHAEEHGADDRAPAKGVTVPLPALLGGIGVLVAVVAIIATISFNAGAKRELNALLKDDGAPPEVQRSNPPAENKNTPAPVTPGPAKNDGAKQPATAITKEIYGDDPRVEGVNYLIVETLMFDEAMSAAEFLTKNNVPCVVVVPQGTKITPSELQKQPRGLWQIIVREGFTRDEYRANGARARSIEESVKQLGRRWKDDQKGTTNFSRCFWKKFGT